MSLGRTEIKDYGWERPDTQAHSYIYPVLEDCLARCGLNPGSLVLDAGCGGGEVLARLNASGYRNLWGFDPAESGIAVAKSSFPRLADRFFVHNAYERSLPSGFPGAAFDAVLSIEVLEHLYDPAAYLENLRSWLKPGGCILISTPYHGYLKNLAISLAGAWDKHHTVDWVGGHIKFFSRRTLTTMLDRSGFKVRYFTGAGRFRGLWKSMLFLAEAK